MKHAQNPDFPSCRMEEVIELLTPEKSRVGKALESRFWPHSLILQRGKEERGAEGQGHPESGTGQVKFEASLSVILFPWCQKRQVLRKGKGPDKEVCCPWPLSQHLEQCLAHSGPSISIY